MARRSLLIASVLMVCAYSADAQTYYYDFTGKVVSSSDSQVAVGSSISGQYVFNLGAIDPSLNQGTITANSYPWARFSNSSTAIFAATAMDGRITLASAPVNPGPGGSSIGGGGQYGESYYSAEGSNVTLNLVYTYLNGPAVFTNQGLPNYVLPGTVANAAFDLAAGDSVVYQLSSLTAVLSRAPEIGPSFAPGALTLLASGLAMMFGRRRRIRP